MNDQPENTANQPVAPNPETPSPQQTPAQPDPLSKTLFSPDQPGEKIKIGRSRKPLLLIVVILLIAGLAYGGYYWQNHKTKKPAGLAAGSQKQLASGAVASQSYSPRLIFVSKTDPKTLLVTDSSNKTLAKASIAQGKNDFSTFASDQTNLIVQESALAQPTDTDASSTFVNINYNGTTTVLPAKVADALRSININSPYLGPDNDMLYISCDATSSTCSLNDLSLADATAKVLLTKPYTADKGVNPTDDSSMFLLGVSGTVAYVQEVVQSATVDTPGTINEFNTSTGKSEHAFQMETNSLNQPVLSHDYKKAIYSDQKDDETKYLMDLTTGKTTDIKSFATDDEDFLWSPDNQKIVFTVNNQGFYDSTGTVPSAQLVYLDLSNSKTTAVDDYGPENFNLITLFGWTSDTKVYYTLSQATTQSDFRTGRSDDAVIDVVSGSANTDPAPSGYSILDVSSPPFVKYP